MGIKYGMGWGGGEFRFRGDLYSQESTFLVYLIFTHFRPHRMHVVLIVF